MNFKLQRGVYALYSEYEIVYVGQTGAGENDRLFHRLKHHKVDHLAERWDRFSWFGTHKVTQTGELTFDASSVALHIPAALNVLEAVSIAISEPRLNLQRGKWGEATQYYQYWEGGGEEDE